MKTRINKEFIASLPENIAIQVTEWKSRHHKAYVSVNSTNKLYILEDGRYTIYNIDGRSKTARAGGEWAGLGDMTCNSDIPLPVGTVAVCEGFFCGVPFLDIYTGTWMPPVKVEEQAQLVEFV